MRIQSSPGNGACLSFDIPLQPTPDAARDADAA